MPHLTSEDEINIYQDLLRKEVEKFRNSQKKDFAAALLTNSDINKIIKKYNHGGEIFNELLRKRMVIKYCDKYRTAHMDLLAKAAFIRQYINSEPYALEYDIMLVEEPFPDFGSSRINDLLQIIDTKLKRDNLPENIIKITKNIIERVLNEYNINGLSSFQRYIIDKILNTDYKYIPLVAPTATGKTLTFVIPALIYLLESIFRGEEPINLMFIYPRKALAKDQIEKFLGYLAIINDELKKYGKKITIALEDGDTPNIIEKNETYRGLKCPRCKGDLIYTRNGIKCNKCGYAYDFIIPTREEIESSPPNILFTNLWTLYRRLLNMKTVNNFKNVKYVVLDEVHAYDGILYYHLKFILRLLFSLKKLTNAVDIEKIVFSSATIPYYREFISKLVCCGNENCIPNDILTYTDFYTKNSSNITKKRLILYEFLLPNIGIGVETLTEDVTEAVLAWLKEYKFKGILFADSIAGITNFYKYFENTILGQRNAREIIDHICYSDLSDLCKHNEYYWPYLSNYRNVCSNNVNQKNLADELKRGIDQHYSVLSLQERLKIEENFKNDPSKLLLFSTSTLELGIDIGDIAVIVQHKLPLSRESFLQRVGRAGRSENTYRIATGIVILQSTPFASLYMFSLDLRNLLFNAGYSSLLNSIDSTNAQIILQYIFSYFLLKRAINKFETCVVVKRDREECETIIKELVEDIDRNLDEYSSELQNALCINLDSIKNDIRNLIDKLKIIINSDIEGEDNNCTSIAKGLKEDINNALSEIYEVINELNESEIEKIIGNKKYILSIVHRIHNKIEQLNDVIYNSSTSINQIKEIIKSIELNAEEINSYIGSLEENKSKLKSTNNLLERMRIKKDLNNLEKIINRLRRAYESIKDLVRDLSDIIADNSVKKCLTTFRYFNKTSPNINENKDIFSIIREKSANDIFIDLLLTPPSPSIELKSIEEVDDNE